MKVNESVIEHIANLARLNLSNDEKSKMAQEMEGIISYMDKLNELDTDRAEPMQHVLPVENVLRKDEVKDSYDREEILKNAPSKEDGCFTVPKVVE